MDGDVGIIILAAGLGTRMRSDKAKVLHEVCGKPMIEHVVQTAAHVAGSNIVVVVGHQADRVKGVIDHIASVGYALQKEQLGTGHAVQCALPHLATTVTDVVILCGDVPLIRSETIDHLVASHIDAKRDVSLLGVKVEDPTGYGRVILDSQGNLSAIVEEADADESQKKIKLINTGIYAVKREFLETALPKLSTDNAQGEVYLTDIIGIGYEQGESIGICIGDDSNEIVGVNSRDDLQLAEKLMINRQI